MTIEFDPLLVVMALPLESRDAFRQAGIRVLYTGVGKVNSTHALTRRLTEYRCVNGSLPVVVNFGTAGSRTFAPGTLVSCHTFVQHDMDVTALGFPRGVTPYDDTPTVLEFSPAFGDIPHGACASGDTFATDLPGIPCHVIDMEAYALAKVCRLEGARFISIKYITDSLDGNSNVEWTRRAAFAAGAFVEAYRRMSHWDLSNDALEHGGISR